ncbi:MAG: condensation domain-containing protein, partial [Calditrichota bacterium]
PIQQWFFSENFAERDHWNQSALVTLMEGYTPKIVEKALELLADHHEALRVYFIDEADQTWQIAAERPTINLDIRDFESPEELEEKIQLAQKELDISKPGGAWQAVYFKNAKAGDNKLLLVFHHLLIDGVSWSVLLEDLSSLIKALSAGSTTKLLPRSASLPEWNEALWHLANKRETFEQVRDWLVDNANSSGKIALEKQTEMSVNTEGNIAKVVLELSEEETAELQKNSKSVFRSSLNELLLATLFHTLQEWTKQRDFRLNMEGHGREEGFGKDASRVVGWFTSFFPLTVKLENTALTGTIAAVKQALEKLPTNGLAISAAQYLSRSETLRNAIHETMKNDVLYNYLGTLDAEYGNGLEYQLISSRSPQAHRSHLLDITAYILNSRLQLQWDFCPDLHDASIIEDLAKQQLGSLQDLLNGKIQADVEYSPADFPLAELTSESLEKVANLLAEIDVAEGL